MNKAITVVDGREMEVEFSISKIEDGFVITMRYYYRIGSRDLELFIYPSKREYSIDVIKHGSWLIGDSSEIKVVNQILMNAKDRQLNTYYSQIRRFKFV